MRHIIIGFSVSAVNAIKSIREIDKNSEIVIISEEDSVYSKPLISYFLAEKLNSQSLSFIDDNFNREYNVKVHLSTKVKKLDLKNKNVILAKNKKLKFDKLLISTGGIPVKPQIKNYTDSVKGIFTFTRLSDAEELIKFLEKNKIKEGVILGAGLIGMKAAEGLLARKIKLKIVELTEHLLANTFDKTASEILEKKLASSGSEFIKGTTIKKIIATSDKINEIILQDGQRIKTKLLIVAIGVKPNLDIIRNTNIKVNKGIVVNEYMKTSVEDVYAAGDVTEALDFLANKNSVIAIWPTAARQGKVAGYAMAGKKLPFEGSFAMNSVEILEIPTISFGITNPFGNGYETLTRKEEDKYKKIVLKDNKIVGIILVNCIERAGIYGLLIREKLDVSEFKKELLEDDFGFLLLPKDFRKHFVRGEGTEV